MSYIGFHELQHEISTNPLHIDLKWNTPYGFGILNNLRYRSLETLKTNDNGYKLVQDTVTGRKFICERDTGHLVQYIEKYDHKYFE